MIKRFKTSYWDYYKTITTLHHYGASRHEKTTLEKKVMRKVTLRIIPFIMLLYFIAFLDRVNIGFAALTMNQDLGFSPTVFGLGRWNFLPGLFSV
ncbi:nitrate/nitrite transporter [Klebsiella pneumoniae]|nr:nitrate/nitrite transporter [Klebsiella pneumoniae]